MNGNKRLKRKNLELITAERIGILISQKKISMLARSGHYPTLDFGANYNRKDDEINGNNDVPILNDTLLA